MAGILAAIALIKGIFWIALIPAFKIADEPSHFENIAFRAEHFQAPHAEDSEAYGTTIHAGSPPDLLLLWKRTHELFRSRYVDGVRSVHEETELRQMARDRASRSGTGRLTSASYPGFYYNSAVPIYEVFKQTSILTRVAAVRFISLLYGIMAVLATFFAARLIMTSQSLAIAAAMIVMLQPMESQMTVAVNNDAGLIGLSGVLFYLQLRFLIRAPEIPNLRWGIFMALVAGALVFTKPQGYSMLPGCGVVCAWIVAKNLRERRAWIFAAVTAACACVLLAASLVHMQHTGQTAVLTATSGGGGHELPRGASPDFLTFLESLDESYKNYLFKSTFGQFGWMEYSIPVIWLDCVGLVWTVVQVGTVAAIVARVVGFPGSSWLSMRGFLFSAFTALFALAFILFAEYGFRLLGLRGVIQGRNLLFGLPALAVVAAASFGALVPKRFRSLSAAALSTSAAGLHIGAIMCIFRNYYGS